MPLPTEMRPPEVLDRTMDYLMNNIMDRGGPGQREDWFDFLWNRTRAIRKVLDHVNNPPKVYGQTS